ncbi:MAG: hypothetical protein WDO16_06095 [Bacteroidota bacterium]
MQQLKTLLACVCSIFISIFSYTQEQPPPDLATHFPGKILSKITSKVNALENEMVGMTEKTIKKFQKRERKIQRKLTRLDSSAAQNIFGNAGQEFASLLDNLKSASPPKTNRVGEYLPNLDSLKVSLKFLDANTLLPGTGSPNNQAATALNSVTSVQDRLKCRYQCRHPDDHGLYV